MRFFKKNAILNYIYQEYIVYPVYFNLSYLWNFGVLSFSFLIIQVVTGIFLAMHYIPSAEFAFLSVEHIMRDINLGWLLRYIHSNGASFFFLCVYFHILRNIYYITYIKPRDLVWVIGMLLFILMILVAFLGYVLPWGQMSFWAATVITSLASVLPIYGDNVVVWLWGGFSVDHATLTRFLSLHYVTPFILIALVFLHVVILHDTGSSNPLGKFLTLDKIWFNPYFTIKDIFSCVLLFFCFCIFLYFLPNYLGHTDNYIKANPLATPAHIVPEWYFLPFYAILRSIPNKAGGILVLLLTLVLLIFLPYFNNAKIKNITYTDLFKWFFYVFALTYLLLGWLGGSPIEFPYIWIGQLFTLVFLVILLFLFNIITLILFFFSRIHVVVGEYFRDIEAN
jgi:quinol-cytochrome oxidoreductase complex cytochrome b subunit